MSQRECRRSLCDLDATDEHTPYCSDDCRKISDSLTRLPAVLGAVSVNPATSTAVVAHAFPWLDARAKAAS